MNLQNYFIKIIGIMARSINALSHYAFSNMHEPTCDQIAIECTIDRN